MIKLDIRKIETFIEVVECKNFSKAAEKLYLTQPTVSAHIHSLEKEITSVEIGEMVMNKLKDLDEVAYVRFASVYRQFKDVNSFMNELKKILDEGSN